MTPSTARSHGSIGRGVLAGLMPLIRLVVLFAIALVLPLIAGLVLSAQGFATQDEVEVIAVAVVLLVAAVVYAISLVGTFRRMRVWREAGLDAQARAALWALLATALIALAPVIVAVLWPQHPAP